MSAADDEYFADGITEESNDVLAQQALETAEPALLMSGRGSRIR